MKSIDQIDIGAFPMLPGQNHEWLVAFLKDILEPQPPTRSIAKKKGVTL